MKDHAELLQFFHLYHIIYDSGACLPNDFWEQIYRIFPAFGAGLYGGVKCGKIRENF